MATKNKDNWSESLSLAQHDKAFGIDAETRKELNDPKGWITNTGTPIKKFSHAGRVKVSKVKAKTTTTSKKKAPRKRGKRPKYQTKVTSKETQEETEPVIDSEGMGTTAI